MHICKLQGYFIVSAFGGFIFRLLYLRWKAKISVPLWNYIIRHSRTLLLLWANIIINEIHCICYTVGINVLCLIIETYFNVYILYIWGAGIAQSVWRLATGCSAEESEFKCLYGQEYSLLHVVQIGSGAHPASYPMGTGNSFPGGKAAGAWSWPLTCN
jgi:hypothetical protein